MTFLKQVSITRSRSTRNKNFLYYSQIPTSSFSTEQTTDYVLAYFSSTKERGMKGPGGFIRKSCLPFHSAPVPSCHVPFSTTLVSIPSTMGVLCSQTAVFRLSSLLCLPISLYPSPKLLSSLLSFSSTL